MSARRVHRAAVISLAWLAIVAGIISAAELSAGARPVSAVRPGHYCGGNAQ